MMRRQLLNLKDLAESARDRWPTSPPAGSRAGATLWPRMGRTCVSAGFSAVARWRTSRRGRPRRASHTARSRRVSAWRSRSALTSSSAHSETGRWPRSPW